MQMRKELAAYNEQRGRPGNDTEAEALDRVAVVPQAVYVSRAVTLTDRGAHALAESAYKGALIRPQSYPLRPRLRPSAI